MPLEVWKNTRKAGVNTNRVDPDPYFFRWEACIPLESKDQGELIGQPCYQHKTCGHLAKVAHDRIPPKVCPWCKVDVVKEAKEIALMEKNGIAIFDLPKFIVNLKRETFAPLSKIAQYLKGD